MRPKTKARFAATRRLVPLPDHREYLGIVKTPESICQSVITSDHATRAVAHYSVFYLMQDYSDQLQNTSKSDNLNQARLNLRQAEIENTCAKYTKIALKKSDHQEQNRPSPSNQHDFRCCNVAPSVIITTFVCGSINILVIVWVTDRSSASVRRRE